MSKDIKSTNIPCLAASEVVNRLVDMWCGAIETEMPFANLPSVMLWGPPGVGKSQAVRQMAGEIGPSSGAFGRVARPPPAQSVSWWLDDTVIPGLSVALPTIQS